MTKSPFNVPHHQTERLHMRALTRKDAPAMHMICNDYDVLKMTGTFTWPFSLEHSEQRIEAMNAMNPAHEQVFGIFLTNSLIGTIGLHNPKQTERWELGYLIGKPWWGQGYATEAVIGMIDWAHKSWGTGIQIGAGHFEDNPASGRVLEKAGFAKTGDIVTIDCAARNTKLASIEYDYHGRA